MNSKIRFAFALASLASVASAAPSAHAAITPIGGGGGGIIGGNTALDILGTGQSTHQTWTAFDWDAKRDTALGNVVGTVNGLVGGIGLNASMDANAQAKVYATANVNQPTVFGTGSSMELVAAAEVGTYVDVSRNNSSVVHVDSRPHVKLDVSYVRPGYRFCLPGNPCASSSPYYREIIELQSYDGTISGLPGFTQSDPLNFSAQKEIFIPSNVLPSFDFSLSGFGVTLQNYLWTEVEATAAAQLNPLGAQATLDTAAFAQFESIGVVGNGIAGAIITLTAMDGQPYSSQFFTHSTAAQAHAKTSLDAGSSLLGRHLCARASGSIDVEQVGAYSVYAYIPGVTLVNQSGNGASFNPGNFTPTPACVSF
jgi:hypothetical protein